LDRWWFSWYFERRWFLDKKILNFKKLHTNADYLKIKNLLLLKVVHVFQTTER